MELSKKSWLALIAMAVSVFMIANDFTALSVAISTIEEDFSTTLNRTQWVINGYTVIFGVLIITGGKLADLLGRKRIFIIGATIFAFFSLLAAISPNIGTLITARALMGVGGAMVWPAVLGMTYAIVPKRNASFAGGLVIGVAGIGNAFGPLLGGFLTDEFSWRWIFFANVPIALLAIGVTYFLVKESPVQKGLKIDYKGIFSLSAGVILLLIGLDQGVDSGFGSPGILLTFLIGALLLLLFVFIERKEAENALIPSSIVSNRAFSGLAVSVLLISAIYFTVLVYIPQFTQTQLDWSALRAGLGLLPLMLVFAATSFIGGVLYDRYGAKKVIMAGATCLTCGVAYMSLVNSSTNYLFLVPGLVVVGIGVGLYYSAVTTAAVTAVKESQSSLAGGIVYMSNVSGGSLGLGLSTAIVLASSTLILGIRYAFVVSAILGLFSIYFVYRYLEHKAR